MMKRNLTLPFFLLSPLSLVAHPAVYHATGSANALQGGFLHPFSGMDHLLVMVAVGLWAVQIGGSALWILPCSFVVSMIVGGFMGLAGLHFTVAEPGILASVILLGAALGMTWRPGTRIASLFVAAGGFCHGYAHGTEMTPGLSPALFLLGMIAATTLLHGMGVGTGLLIRESRFVLATRIAGFFILGFAVYALLG